MVTSRLVSGGKQESGATVGVNWRCSGEPSGLGGGRDGGGGGDCGCPGQESELDVRS